MRSFLLIAHLVCGGDFFGGGYLLLLFTFSRYDVICLFFSIEWGGVRFSKVGVIAVLGVVINWEVVYIFRWGVSRGIDSDSLLRVKITGKWISLDIRKVLGTILCMFNIFVTRFKFLKTSQILISCALMVLCKQRRLMDKIFLTTYGILRGKSFL